MTVILTTHTSFDIEKYIFLGDKKRFTYGLVKLFKPLSQGLLKPIQCFLQFLAHDLAPQNLQNVPYKSLPPIFFCLGSVFFFILTDWNLTTGKSLFALYSFLSHEKFRENPALYYHRSIHIIFLLKKPIASSGHSIQGQIDQLSYLVPIN